MTRRQVVYRGKVKHKKEKILTPNHDYRLTGYTTVPKILDVNYVYPRQKMSNFCIYSECKTYMRFSTIITFLPEVTSLEKTPTRHDVDSYEKNVNL